MSHPFGDLLRQYCARKHGLTQTRLAHRVGYDGSVITRMGQGGKDLTGPSGRDRVVQVITVLRDEGVLRTLDEANNLLNAAGMPPLYDGYPNEAILIGTLLPPVPTALAGPSDIALQKTNLPASVTRLIGRDHDVAEVLRLMETMRLLTLTGAGGVGKTRLALEVGGLIASGRTEHLFRDGVWLVELASLMSPALVAHSVLAIFNLPPSIRPAEEVLLSYLRSKHTLLILDNCEHLIAACAVLVEQVLKGCPQVRILATSREGLNIAGEVVWRVPSLSITSGTELFIERGQKVWPDFRMTQHNAQVIAQIVNRLDGIPLALELAASRLSTLSVEQIAGYLDDRFTLLTGGSRTALTRHHTLRELIDWSYNLLTEPEKTLLQRLSVFRGGWSLAAALEVNVGTETLELLAQLVNKSLVVVNNDNVEIRYHLLETILQYAAEKQKLTNDTDMARARHCNYFIRYAA